MEAVKLESLPRGSFPGVANLQIAQEALGTITVVTSCGTQHLLVHIGLYVQILMLYLIFLAFKFTSEFRRGGQD